MNRLKILGDVIISTESGTMKMSGVKLDTNGEKLFGYAGDLSIGGMFVRTDRLLNQGEKLRIRFSIPDGGPEIATEAEVVWTRTEGEGEPGMGVRFNGLSEESSRRIKIFLDEGNG